MDPYSDEHRVFGVRECKAAHACTLARVYANLRYTFPHKYKHNCNLCHTDKQNGLSRYKMYGD